MRETEAERGEGRRRKGGLAWRSAAGRCALTSSLSIPLSTDQHTDHSMSSAAQTTNALAVPSGGSGTAICAAAEAFVRNALAGYDASHDWHHIARVRALTLSLAAESGVSSSAGNPLELVELAALLHDVADWKYSGSESAGVDAARTFLTGQQYSPERVEIVATIIERVGFKSELARRDAAAAAAAAGTEAAVVQQCPAEVVAAAAGLDLPLLAGLVQDADRLDAIGATGIARCFTFGGAKGRALYDPSVPLKSDVTAAEYKSAASLGEPTLNHFYTKLFKLKDMMKTDAGKKRAEQRHQFMVEFVEQFQSEIAGKA